MGETPRMALVPVEATVEMCSTGSLYSSMPTMFTAMCADSPNGGKVSQDQLGVVADAIERWLDDCWIQEEAPTPRSGAATALRALGLEIEGE